MRYGRLSEDRASETTSIGRWRRLERGDIGLHAELHAGRLARPLDDHAIIAVRLLQKPS